MKRCKNIFTMLLSFVMSFAMILSLSACGKNDAGTTKEKTTEDTKQTDVGKDTEQVADAEEPVNLTVAFAIFGETPMDLNKINEKINEYLKEKVNATITLLPISGSSYSQQIDLMLTSGEKLDLLVDGTITALFNYTSHASKGQLYPMKDLLDEYGQGIQKAMGKYLDAAVVNGEIYGVPTNRDLAARVSLLVRSSLLEKYKIDPASIKTYEDMEGLFQTIKEKEPSVTPLMIADSASGTIFDSLGLSFDTAGDQLSDMIGVLMDNQVLKVADYYETEECKAACKRIRDWYEKGYVLQDAATNQSSPTDLIKAGTVFGYISNSKPGMEAQIASTVGEDITEIPLTEALSDTQKVTGFMWAIAGESKYSEKAMEVLNLMYTDPVFINLLDHGIEGVHYKVVDKENNIIDFADGVTPDTTGYDMNIDFQFGNQLLSYIWEGDSPTLWKDMEQFNTSAKVSKAMGFQFDATKVKTEYASVNAVINQYKTALGQGTVDPTQYLPEFIQKLKAAGIDAIVTEKQAQLDAFVKAGGND